MSSTLAHTVRRRLPSGRLLARFESLGDNCEFGLLQRHHGVESLGLFRLSAAPLQGVVECLQNKLAEMSEPADLNVWLAYDEYVVQFRRYKINYHTLIYAKDMSMEAFLARELKKLSFVVRAMRETLEDGEKIFLVKQNEPAPLEQIEALVAALRGFNARTQLLWVVPAASPETANAVRRAGPGLLIGEIEAFAPYERAELPEAPRSWIAVCRHAAELIDAEEGS